MPNWSDVLKEINDTVHRAQVSAQGAADTVRRKYLAELHDHTQRNVIAYYSGFLSKPEIFQAQINDEDKNGFMTAIHGLDRSVGLDLIIHSPGGNLAATQSLVYYLQRMFDSDIRAMIPQIALSAGTMIACCCKSIVMGKQSNLGPVDPQLRGIPARGVVDEFKRAFKEIKNEPAKVHVWKPILQQYHPTFLGSCENAIEKSKQFVREQLESNMLKGVKGKKQRAGKIIKHLTDYRGGHDRHIHINECEAMGLKVERLEDDRNLQDLLLTTHHCYMHSLTNTSAYKIIENQRGVAMIKQRAHSR